MDSNNINKNEEKINHLNMILRLTIFTGLFVGIFVSIYYYFAQFSNSPYAELDNSNYQFILDNYEKYPSNKKMIFLISNFYSGNKVGINRKDYENYFDFLIDRKNEKGVQLNSIININYMKINNYEDDKENAIRQSHYNKFAKLLDEYNQNEILKSDYLTIQGLLLEDDKELNNKIHFLAIPYSYQINNKNCNRKDYAENIIDIENKVAKLIRLMFIALRMESALEYHVYRFDNFHRLPIFHLHIFQEG